MLKENGKEEDVEEVLSSRYVEWNKVERFDFRTNEILSIL